MATTLHDFYRYEVLFTVLIGKNTYGETIDVTQDIDITELVKSISAISNDVDNGDYDIGVFVFGDITITALNNERKFSPPEDWKSIFPYSRDKTKVDVNLYDKNGTKTLSFRGLINDDATRQEINSEEIKFRVLSLDSILRQVRVSGGQVSSNQNFSVAIKNILNVPEITNVVDYSPARISVELDLPINDGDYFTDLSAKDALDELLLASNSVLYIDKQDRLFVKPRTESVNIFYFQGRGDEYGRENIFNISAYNTGVQRAFSSVKINETVATDVSYVDIYGFRQKDIGFDFITNVETEALIAQNILNAFKAPKEELEIEVPLEDSAGIELFDLVSVALDYRLVPYDIGGSLPLYGVAEYGVAKYPIAKGSNRIDPSKKWKVISIRENPTSLSRTLKLRIAGTTFGDGVFLEGEAQNVLLLENGDFLITQEGDYFLRE